MRVSQLSSFMCALTNAGRRQVACSDRLLLAAVPGYLRLFTGLLTISCVAWPCLLVPIPAAQMTLSILSCTFQNYIEVKVMQQKMNHFKSDNSVAFSAFTMLCKHYSYLVLKHFYCYKVLSSFCPILSTTPPHQPSIYSLSLWIYLF